MSRPLPDQPEPLFTTGVLRWRAPVGRHRRTGTVRPGGWLVALVVAAVVVAAGGAVTNTELNADQRFREFVTSGSMGEPVSARTLRVTVLSVATGAELADSDAGGRAYDTDGVWVLVRLRAEALEEPAWIRYAAVRDSAGRTWWATGRVSQFLVGTYRLDPAIPVEGDIAFEVPPEAATDLTIRLAGGGSRADLRMQAVAEVALPVDRAAVAPEGAEPVEFHSVPRVSMPDVAAAGPPAPAGTG